MTTFPLRLTEELKVLATAQAARAGVSLNQYIATVLAAHVGRDRQRREPFRRGPANGGLGRGMLNEVHWGVKTLAAVPYHHAP